MTESSLPTPRAAPARPDDHARHDYDRYGRPEDVLGSRSSPFPEPGPADVLVAGARLVGQRRSTGTSPPACRFRAAGPGPAPPGPHHSRCRRLRRRRRCRRRRPPLPGRRRGVRPHRQRRLRRVRRGARRLVRRQAARVDVRAGRHSRRGRRDRAAGAARLGPAAGKASECWSTAPRVGSAPSPCRSRRRWAPRTSPRCAAPATSRPLRGRCRPRRRLHAGGPTAGPGERYDLVFDNAGVWPLRRCGQLLVDGGSYVMVTSPKSRWLHPLPRMIAGPALLLSSLGRAPRASRSRPATSPTSSC